jgi:hypothetical protein
VLCVEFWSFEGEPSPLKLWASANKGSILSDVAFSLDGVRAGTR